MQLPWLQVANEMIDQAAPDIAVRLELDEDLVVGKLVRLIRWALGRVPDGELPSRHAVVQHPRVELLLAKAARYTGDAEAFTEALCCSQDALLARVPGGVRFQGLDRYDAAVDGEAARTERARKAAEARWGKNRADAQAVPEHSLSTARTMLGDAETQTQTQIETTTPLTPLQKGGLKSRTRRVSKRDAALEARLYPSGRPTVRLCEGCEQRNASGAMGNEPGRWLCQRCVDVVDGHRGRFDEDCQGFFDFVDEWVEQQRRQRSAVQQA